jgi:hypothetical protein
MDLKRKGHECLVHSLYSIVVTIWNLWVSKDAEFYLDFKNINLHYSNMHMEKVI